MPSFIPPELLQAMLEPLSTRDLAHCCLASKSFLSIAQSLLYVQVSLYLGFDNAAEKVWRACRFDPNSNLLRSTLRLHPHVAALVKEIRIYTMRPICRAWNSCVETTVDALKEVLQLAPNAKACVLFPDYLHSIGLDNVVLSYQLPHHGEEVGGGGRGSQLVFRTLAASALLNSLSARYEGIKLESDWDAGSQSLNLQASATTLRRLSLWLKAPLELSLFTQLEHLEIKLGDYGTIRFDTITQTIVNLVSLRRLIVSGPSRQQYLEDLVRNGNLARSLPPRLSHLSVGHNLSPSTLLRFLFDLIGNTGLQRFNYFRGKSGEEAEEEGEEEGELELEASRTTRTAEEDEDEEIIVLRAFEKRGIKLSYDQDWTLW